MAFKDHCSPQSAASPPPGIPHSPHNTATMLYTSEINNSNSNISSGSSSHSSLSIDQEMSTQVSHEQEQRTPSVSPLHCVTVKQETEENYTINHENDDIDPVDDMDAHPQEQQQQQQPQKFPQHQAKDQQPSRQPQTSTSITFSITNILSNSFGKLHKKSTEKKSILFRPYDDDVVSANKRSNLVKVNNNRSTEERNDSMVSEIPMKSNEAAIDFSNRSLQSHHLAALNNNLEVAKYPNLFPANQFPTVLPTTTPIYPKLHEDILSSTKKYHQYYQTTQLLTDNALAKYPPLGNLCKTVSQIGQTSPALNGNKSSNLTPKSFYNRETRSDMVSPSSTCTRTDTPSSGGITPSSKQQSNSLDSGMESSDDTKSETSSTKEENGSQLWPAWIYCTRYSDRPSSGNLHFCLIFSFRIFYMS